MSISEDRIDAVVWGVTVSIVIAKELDLSERRFVNFVRHVWRISEDKVDARRTAFPQIGHGDLPQSAHEVL